MGNQRNREPGSQRTKERVNQINRNKVTKEPVINREQGTREPEYQDTENQRTWERGIRETADQKAYLENQKP